MSANDSCAMIRSMLEASSPVLIQAVYELTEREFYEAQVRHSGSSGRITRIIGAIILVCALASLSTHHYAQASIGIVLGIVFIFGLRISTSLAFKREASLKLKTTIVASEEGFETVNSRGKSTLNWSAFTRFTETRNIFMLYVQSRMFHLIPKRALSPEDVDRLRELLKRHISTKPAGRTGNPNLKVFLFFLIVAAAIVMVYLAIHRIHA